LLFQLLLLLLLLLLVLLLLLGPVSPACCLCLQVPTVQQHCSHFTHQLLTQP
jgi:hypothetical protein